MSPELKAVATVSRQPSGLAITSWEGLLSRADYFAKSQLIPQALRGKPADIAIILQMGHELDIDPMQAINGINVIQGKPSVSPELALGIIRSRFPNALIKIETKAGPEVTVTMARDKREPDQAFTTTWNMARAKAMNLAGKDNYRTQPEVMLKWRAVGEAARTVFPDALKGLYVGPEVEDLPPEGDDKGARIVEAIERAAIEVKPEPKTPEVLPAESHQPQPEPVPAPDVPVSPTVEEPAHPILDYALPVGNGLQGKRLKEIDWKQLKDWKAKTTDFMKANRREIKGPWLEAFAKIDAYVAIKEEETSVFYPTEPAFPNPEENFEPGASG